MHCEEHSPVSKKIIAQGAETGLEDGPIWGGYSGRETGMGGEDSAPSHVTDNQVTGHVAERRIE